MSMNLIADSKLGSNSEQVEWGEQETPVNLCRDGCLFHDFKYLRAMTEHDPFAKRMESLGQLYICDMCLRVMMYDRNEYMFKPLRILKIDHGKRSERFRKLKTWLGKIF